MFRAIRMPLWLSAGAAALALAAPAPAVTVDWVTVGNPGNLGDIEVSNDGSSGYGAVAYVYQIGRTEVTNSQYVQLLNAVAVADTNGLYSPSMGSTDYGGITQTGSPGSYGYAAIPGREQWPVNYVSFYDALRFANWMNNGQPSGAQDATTTEDGSYTITAQGIADNSIARNPGATIALTSEDEWYKAAYHDAVGLSATDYYDYPAGTSSLMSCAYPATAAPNTANCDDLDPVVGLTDVGSYTGSPSPYGTFDQAGNVWEWMEQPNLEIGGTDLYRSSRGGGFDHLRGIPFPPQPFLAAGHRDGLTPTLDSVSLGFRLAMVPEPGTGLLVVTGLLGLAYNRRKETRR